jgi:hypothetical protein
MVRSRLWRNLNYAVASSASDLVQALLLDTTGQLALVPVKGAMMPVPSGLAYPPLVIQASDISAAHERCVKAGYKISFGLKMFNDAEFGETGVLVVNDPDGYIVEVVNLGVAVLKQSFARNAVLPSLAS